MVEYSRKGMCIQPGWSEDIGAALAFEQESKPERNITPLRWVKRSQRALHSSQIVCEGT